MKNQFNIDYSEPYNKDTLNIAKHAVDQISQQRESLIMDQLNDFVSRGLIEIEVGPLSFFRSSEGSTIVLNETVNLKLKDREYIEQIEKENKELKEIINKLKELLND